MKNPVANSIDSAPDSARLATDSLADSVVILLALTVVQRGVGFLRGILFCRWLDPEQLGQWDLSYGFLMMAAPLAVLGLPGSLGRYVETYRQQGQLGTFVRRMIVWTVCLSALGMTVLAALRVPLARFVFGSEEFANLILVLAAGLGAVGAFNFLTSLFTALRLYRVVCALQFFSAVGFAALGVFLLFAWRTDALAVIVAFAASCLIASLGSLVWLRRALRAIPLSSAAVSSRTILAKLLPFALWMWVTNWLSNTFDLVDRYMLIHYSGLSAAEALEQVGQYHSSRVVPLLFVGVADLLAAMITPHLSYDWESGRREAVSQRLNLFLKMFAFGLSAAGVALVAIAPALFNAAFGGKYAEGLGVLPWTVAYCSWGALSIIAHNYLLCAEKARHTSLTFLVGLIVNIGLNLWLLPIWGLLGAVVATASAHAVALSLSYAMNWLSGMKLDRGTLLVSTVPGVLALFGPWIALGALGAIVVYAAVGSRLLTHEEKQQLTTILGDYWRRVRGLVARNQTVAAR